MIRGLYGSPAKMPTSARVFNEELTEKLFKLAHAVALGKLIMFASEKKVENQDSRLQLTSWK